MSVWISYGRIWQLVSWRDHRHRMYVPTREHGPTFVALNNARGGHVGTKSCALLSHLWHLWERRGHKEDNIYTAEKLFFIRTCQNSISLCSGVIALSCSSNTRTTCAHKLPNIQIFAVQN